MVRLGGFHLWKFVQSNMFVTYTFPSSKSWTIVDLEQVLLQPCCKALTGMHLPQIDEPFCWLATWLQMQVQAYRVCVCIKVCMCLPVSVVLLCWKKGFGNTSRLVARDPSNDVETAACASGTGLTCASHIWNMICALYLCMSHKRAKSSLQTNTATTFTSVW